MADTTSIRPLVAGNWKMNGMRSSLAELTSLAQMLTDDLPLCDTLICPPFTLLSQAAMAVNGSLISLGAQDCHENRSGAHTGDVSADMIMDLGCSYIIVGHSERRADHGETNAVVKAKAAAAISAGAVAIICVGETEAQRDAGDTLKVIEDQIKGSLPEGANAQNTVIAYEPVWAIGTGRTPSVEDVAQVHHFIRGQLEAYLKTGAQVRILYGGSVKPSNAQELMAASDVNGALVGGASLKAKDFNGIIDAYRSK
jgi:triosephosphate isomerase